MTQSDVWRNDGSSNVMPLKEKSESSRRGYTELRAVRSAFDRFQMRMVPGIARETVVPDSGDQSILICSTGLERIGKALFGRGTVSTKS
jgi:hypothetical protein